MLNPEDVTKDAPRALRVVQFIGYLVYFGLMGWLGLSVILGYAGFGNPWLVVLTAIGGYLLADLLSGIVHFLADNFGTGSPRLRRRGARCHDRSHSRNQCGSHLSFHRASPLKNARQFKDA